MRSPGAIVVNPAETWLSLHNDGRATAVEAATFLEKAMAGELDLGPWVVGTHTEDSPSWAMHPSGECILIVASGSMDVFSLDGEDVRLNHLKAGQACIVPRGVWHRQVMHDTGLRVWITAGEGSQMRPIEQDEAPAKPGPRCGASPKLEHLIERAPLESFRLRRRFSTALCASFLQSRCSTN
jgi:mannose-6-phosphate isomerase-like protein (cupin superfamily)